MDRPRNNIVGSMVLSLSENIVCHFVMPLNSLWVIFDNLPRFLKKGLRTDSVTSSLLELLIAAKNVINNLDLPFIVAYYSQSNVTNPQLH